MKLSQKQLRLLIIALVAIILISVGWWAYQMYRNEQIRQKDAENSRQATKIAKETYTRAFSRLQHLGDTQKSASISEIVQESVDEYLSDDLKHEIVTKKGGITQHGILGCRNRLSDALLKEGFLYETPTKQGDHIFIVPAVWKGKANDPDDQPSRALVSVDMSIMKIVKFDCKQTDSAQREAQVNAEKKAQEEKR